MPERCRSTVSPRFLKSDTLMGKKRMLFAHRRIEWRPPNPSRGKVMVFFGRPKQRRRGERSIGGDDG